MGGGDTRDRNGSRSGWLLHGSSQVNCETHDPRLGPELSPVQSSLPPPAAHSHWYSFHGLDIADSRISGSRSIPNSVEIQLRPASSSCVHPPNDPPGVRESSSPSKPHNRRRKRLSTHIPYSTIVLCHEPLHPQAIRHSTVQPWTPTTSTASHNKLLLVHPTVGQATSSRNRVACPSRASPQSCCSGISNSHNSNSSINNSNSHISFRAKGKGKSRIPISNSLSMRNHGS